MRVFLSSTFVDLKLHRLAANEAIERLGQQTQRMEIFGARPEEPMNACLSEVEACDLFVGIYAHRYGFIPSGFKTSITELEFECAIDRKKPVLAFLVDEDFPWSPRMIDGGEAAKKLGTFCKRLRSMLVVETFTSPESLSSKVAASVARHMNSLEFTRHLNRPFPQVIYDSDVGTNPFSQWTLYSSEGGHSQRITKRQKELEPASICLQAFSGEDVGVNKAMPILVGRVEFSYRIESLQSKSPNIIFYAIPMQEIGVGRDGLLEVGADIENHPNSHFSLFRQRHIPPLSDYSDGQWHDASLLFDFRKTPGAFYSIFGPRINEGSVDPSPARLLIRSVRVVAQI